MDHNRGSNPKYPKANFRKTGESKGSSEILKKFQSDNSETEYGLKISGIKVWAFIRGENVAKYQNSSQLSWIYSCRSERGHGGAWLPRSVIPHRVRYQTIDDCKNEIVRPVTLGQKRRTREHRNQIRYFTSESVRMKQLL